MSRRLWVVGGALVLVRVWVGVGPAFEQGADDALCFSVGLWPVGPRLLDADLALAAGVRPAALEALAVVAEYPLDTDAVTAVEAQQLLEKGERRVGGLVGVQTGEAEPAGVVDGDKQVPPASFAGCPTCPIAGDAMSGDDDPAQLLTSTWTSSPGRSR